MKSIWLLDRTLLSQGKPLLGHLQEYVSPAFCISGRSMPVAVSRPFTHPGTVGSHLEPLVMIELHYWTTPNGHKITMFLEEAGLEYKIVPVHIGKGERFKPEFLAISPNNRIRALIDHKPKDGGKPVSVFESGAMLLYLAEKTGKFLSADTRRRYETIEWLFWQMGGLGP